MNNDWIRPSALRFTVLLWAALAVQVGCGKKSPTGSQAAAGDPPGVRSIRVTAHGFEPSRVEVPPGQPVTLRFTRTVAETCADAVDVQGDPIRHMLPLDRAVDVALLAPASGQVAFACPMKMFRGAAVVVAQ